MTDVTERARELVLAGTLSMTGRKVIVDFDTREDAEAMVAALRERSLSVEYRLFAGERHGIREAHHLAEALRAEHAFYERLRQSN